MALGDYILCCKCDVKLIYDGDKGNREWWAERFGAEPAILCPNCDKRPWVGLTREDSFEIAEKLGLADVAWLDLMKAIQAKLKDKNTP